MSNISDMDRCKTLKCFEISLKDCTDFLTGFWETASEKLWNTSQYSYQSMPNLPVIKHR